VLRLVSGFRRHRGHLSPLAAVLVTAAVVASCNGDGGTTPDEDDQGPAVVDLELDVTHAPPAAAIRLQGIPADLDLSAVHARVVDRATGAEQLTYVGRWADGTPYLVAPLLASGLEDGGEVDVFLAGDEVSSEGARLTIDPLPEATTSIEQVVDLLQELTTAWLAHHGTTRAELRSMDPEEIPARMLPLFVAQELLDSPDNPNSLRAMVDGPIPLFDGEPVDFDLADRLLSLADSEAFFAPEIGAVDSATADHGELLRGVAVPRHDARGGCISGGDYGIVDAGSLDRAMWASRFAMARLGGASGQYLNDLGRFVGVLGQIPQLKQVASAVGGVLYVYKSLNEASSAVLPSAFNGAATNFDIQDKDQLFEDDEGGNWANFRVTAVSQGWKMDEFLLGALAQVAGFQDLGGLATLTEGLSELATALTEFAFSEAIGALIGAVAGGSDIIEICPGSWEGIDVSALPYSEASIPFGTSVAFVDRTFYETQEPGVSEVRLETKDGFFGGATTFAVKPVEVLTILVDVTPADVELEVTDAATFTATVQNAHDDRVEWRLPAGLEEVSQSDFGRTITVKAPSAPWSPPLILVARSQATTGSREGMVDEDPRDGGAVIAYKGRRIEVTPRSICLQNGETEQFEAEVVGVDDPEVRWSLDSGWGSIDAVTGLYRAPEVGTTDDVIVAEVVGEDDLRAYANVRVGACVCSFTISVGGASVWSASGPDMVFQTLTLPGEPGFIQWFFVVPEGPDGPMEGNFAASLAGTKDDPAPEPGDTGTYAVNAVYVSPGGQSWVSNQDDDDAGVVLQIDAYTATSMEGSMTGTAVQRNDPKDPDRITSTVFVTMQFRAGFFDGTWPCGE
jgi:hypothetical protein